LTTASILPAHVSFGVDGEAIGDLQAVGARFAAGDFHNQPASRKILRVAIGERGVWRE
jgi:hypothetical protein